MQVNTLDTGGGAAGIAFHLCEEYRRLGHDSWLVVGRKRSSAPHVFLVPDTRAQRPWYRLWAGISAAAERALSGRKGASRIQRAAAALRDPRRWLQRQLGYEAGGLSGSWEILDLAPARPHVLHCHNLHGSVVGGGPYFALDALPWLSQRLPVVLTLHDAWLLSGHCAHSFGCERWTAGCGQCPDLSIYPAIRRDGTARNWRRKQGIFARSRLYVATPCQWLMEKVQRSILATGMVEGRVIPNGVDLEIFHPADLAQARLELGIPVEARVLLFVANGISRNVWKDYGTLRTALALVAERFKEREVRLVALGEDAGPERVGNASVEFVPYCRDAKNTARYYRAADVYVHAARADTFPTTVLEAMACGIPVAATAVGGIPEQIRALRGLGNRAQAVGWDEYGLDIATGMLVPPSDPEAMAAGIEQLLLDDGLRERLGANAAQRARACFDLGRHAGEYLAWYQDILERWAEEKRP